MIAPFESVTLQAGRIVLEMSRAITKYEEEYGARPAHLILSAHAYFTVKRGLNDLLSDSTATDTASFQGIPIVVSAQTAAVLELAGPPGSLRSMAVGVTW